ncbi:tetratricopeptide repeat protein [Lacunisphaera limnophila]|uniref:Tetratricopeptide repeat protein n=1 Tax=Lacunisphaera limnophila TaxID=1838286 RepID=A0A1D8ARR9_9BACT|nr:tetratricopeptide repeat protein [Lacunisphaera limnophila]AOS43595.1 tetratricopeptide repeat protein [Lacunisphaera limnophila]
MVGAVLLLVALGGAGGYLWQRAARNARVRADLPALPATGTNATLRDLLAQARAAAETGRLEAVAELGRLCHANEFRPEAEACWRLLIREQPGEARWHYYLADLRRMAGDQAETEAALERTVAADGTAATAWLQLAEMKFKSGRPDAAETAYRRRLALLPGDPYAELGLARIAQLRGQADDTSRRLELILAQHPKFSAAHNLYAELQSAAGREDLADLHRWLGREAGRFREAEDPWLEDLNERCYDPRRLCHLGVIAYQTNHGDRGRARFERALALAPSDPLPYEMLGSLLLELGSAEAARALLADGIARAERTAPSPQHYLRLSEACRTLQQPEPARQALVDGLRRHPDSPELLHARGNQLKADGQTAEAAAAYRRALELNPAFVEADFALALLLLETGRPAEAVAALDHALSMQPTFPKARLLLARLEMEVGRFDAAGHHLLPLLKANPGSPEIRQIVASWRLQAGRAAEKSDPAAAEQHYRAGLALVPDQADLNAGLGVRLLVTDRVPEAVPLLETFYRLQPANPQAALFLGQAYARSGRMPDARRVLAAGLDQAERAGQTATARNFREILSMLPR